MTPTTTRETVDAKARRLLALGRVYVVECDEEHAMAIVQGESEGHFDQQQTGLTTEPYPKGTTMTIESNYTIDDDVRPLVGEQPKPAWVEPNYSVTKVPVRDVAGRFVGYGFEHRHEGSRAQFIRAADPAGTKRDPWTGAIVADEPAPTVGPSSAPYVRPGGEPGFMPTPAQRQAQAGVLRDRVFSRTASLEDLIELAVGDDPITGGLAGRVIDHLGDGDTVDLSRPNGQILDAWAARNPSLVVDLAVAPDPMIELANLEYTRWAIQMVSAYPNGLS